MLKRLKPKIHAKVQRKITILEKYNNIFNCFIHSFPNFIPFDQSRKHFLAQCGVIAPAWDPGCVNFAKKSVDMSVKKRQKHPYRIGLAAIGRMYVRMICDARSTVVSEAQFRDMMFGMMCYIEDPGWVPAPDAEINPEVMERVRADVDRSARLSEAARRRAARRKVAAADAAADRHEERARAYPGKEVASIVGRDCCRMPQAQAAAAPLAAPCVPEPVRVPAVSPPLPFHAGRRASPPGKGACLLEVKLPSSVFDDSSEPRVRSDTEMEYHRLHDRYPGE